MHLPPPTNPHIYSASIGCPPVGGQPCARQWTPTREQERWHSPVTRLTVHLSGFKQASPHTSPPGHTTYCPADSANTPPPPRLLSEKCPFPLTGIMWPYTAAKILKANPKNENKTFNNQNGGTQNDIDHVVPRCHGVTPCHPLITAP